MFFGKKKEHEEFGEKMLICPRCNKKMQKVMKGTVIIDICEHCGGMWLDKGEIEKLNIIAKRDTKKK